MTVDEQLIKLRRIAHEFRRAIELSDKNSLPTTFKDFPDGSCGDAALLLGTYLLMNGYGEFRYILGERGSAESWCSQVWLTQGDLIVDITADQFPDSNEKVVVCRGSEWHKPFRGTDKGKADYRSYDDRTAAVLEKAYKEILSHLPRIGVAP